MKKALTAFTLILLVAFSLITISTVQGEVTDGKITSDTTWTKTNSPYTITGTLTVNIGAILTIEPGVTINIPFGSKLEIEGTLVAKGTNTDNINFNGGGDLVLTPTCCTWNPQTSKGTILENTVINTLPLTVFSSVKINNNTIFNHMYLYGGSPQITYNSIAGFIDSNASLQAPVISNNNIMGSIIIKGGSPTITHNIIKGINPYIMQSSCTGIALIATYGPENRLYDATITDNTITDCLDGISSLAEGGLIANNLITNCSRKALTLGTMPETTLYASVKNNTITNSTVGIELFNYNGASKLPTPFIQQNNIDENSQYNVYSYCDMNISMTDNWWGTTDMSAIEQTIRDRTLDPVVGVVDCSSFLTEPNPYAYPNVNSMSASPVVTIPVDSNSTGSTQLPNGFMLEINHYLVPILVGVVVVVGVLLGFVVWFIKRKIGR